MDPIGVYVHFPWCLKKCAYCDFVSFAREREAIDHAGYAEAVLGELRTRSAALRGRRLASVFFGGGTPSLWAPEQLGRVLAAVRAAAPDAAPDLEVTVECNPTSLDEDRARALLAVGVNRLSIGVQGLDEGRLRFLGRLHDPAGGLASVEAALSAGAPRVSADFIYGVATPGPGSGGQDAPVVPAEQAPEEAAREAVRIAATGVSHLSAYSLTIEPGTQFGELARRGRLPIAAEDGVAESFFAIERALEEQGFEHYEVSNYARPGHEARHNLGYWRGHDYLGLGCAAFGTLGDPSGAAVRYRNRTDPGRYMADVLAGAPVLESEERLDPETRLRERIMLGLRLRAGLDLEEAARELGLPAWSAGRKRAADRLVAGGRLSVEGGVLRIPKGATIYADGVAAALF
jgi:putative oxygen-independent coproporphyrinogen III oxidase